MAKIYTRLGMNFSPSYCEWATFLYR